jgi:hypothetical protein
MKVEPKLFKRLIAMLPIQNSVSRGMTHLFLVRKFVKTSHILEEGALPHELIDARRNFIDKNQLNNDSKKFPCKTQDYGGSRSWTCF